LCDSFLSARKMYYSGFENSRKKSLIYKFKICDTICYTFLE